MKNHIRLISFLSLSLLLNACSSQGDSDAASGENFPSAVNSKVQVFSAKDQGINIVPQFQGEDLAGCTIISNSSGQAEQVDGRTCSNFIKEVQRPPAPFCQVLLNNSTMIAFEPSKCTNMVSDGQIATAADNSAKRAAVHANNVMNYYLDHHNRRGLNNQNGDIVSMVHVGNRMGNAFFDPQLRVMSYGDGDGQNSLDFTLAADVAAHEMTHGVVAYTARLIYQDESGALDEATADFFGELATGGDWTLGKEVSPSGTPIRNMADPGSLSITLKNQAGESVRFPYPNHTSGMLVVPQNLPCNGSNDQCFVHFNSTVPGHAGYMMVQAIGAEKAEKIWYLALTQFFTPSISFQGAANSMMMACQQLYTDADCDKVAAAWGHVGLRPR